MEGIDSKEHWWTSCQTRGFVDDVLASGVATIPDGNYRSARYHQGPATDNEPIPTKVI